ncbi:MAG: hypothetical protein JOZ72_07760 [Alphaproteobacteria bacterium]|nr:hypothetical protein [Alphaproteobacteria bacterium]
MIRIRTIALLAGLACAAAAPTAAAAGTFGVMHPFVGPPTDGEYPQAGLILNGSDLYGTTFGSLSDTPGKHCSKSCGNVYGLINSEGEPQMIHAFGSGENGDSDGSFPTSEVTLNPANGFLYGTTEYGVGNGCGGLGCGTFYKVSSDGSTEKAYKFCLLAACADGVFPHGSLALDANGRLYGVAMGGGTGAGWLCGSSFGGCGTVYQVTAGGPRPIYSFCKTPQNNVCTDGAVPYGGLVADEAKNLYGTTQFGGVNLGGTVFKVTSAGVLTVLHSFCAQGDCAADGAVPQTTMIISNGNLFGTTTYGGNVCQQRQGCGVVFRMALDGSGFAVLHRFSGGQEGALPMAPVLADGSGNLYGTTLRGGVGTCGRGSLKLGCGTLYQLPAAGGTLTTLHAFNDTDGVHPQGRLALENGVLYGVTRDQGDPVCLCGTLYKYALATAAPKVAMPLH